MDAVGNDDGGGHRPGVAGRTRKVWAVAWTRAQAVDGLFFVVATGLVLWLGWELLRTELSLSWQGVVSLVAFWLLTAYVGLPRLQQVLTKIYVPDYFIGRTLTGSGILGDPVNLAVDGTEAQIHAAMSRAGWTRADDVTVRSSLGIIVSAVFRRSYDAAPVSPLFLFGRPEAFAYEQEVDGNASQRHHVRFWPTPPGWLLPGGRRVDWLAAGTFDRAIGLSLFTLQVTHKVDADIDVERDHVVSTVTSSVPGATRQVLANFVAAFHARNGGGDVIHTDGDLVVLDLAGVTSSDAPSPVEPATQVAAIAAHHLPPPALLLAGTVSVLKTLGGALALGTLAIPSALLVVLWLSTLVRQAWARLLLMVVCTVDAVVQLGAVSGHHLGHSGLARLLYAGASVLILVTVSSDEARRWVARRA